MKLSEKKNTRLIAISVCAFNVRKVVRNIERAAGFAHLGHFLGTLYLRAICWRGAQIRSIFVYNSPVSAEECKKRTQCGKRANSRLYFTYLVETHW